MRHLRGRSFVIALQRVETQIDAGRQHQPVIAERRAVGEPDGPRRRIDGRCRLRHHGHAAGGDLVVAELLLLDRAQSGDHVVAERAGGEGPVRLDQRDLQFRIDLFQRARTTRAAKAAADHDDARRGLREGGQRKRQRRCRGGASRPKTPGG